ncbi:hypothetical protein ACHAWF_007781 [Thalassiosira exigua]
MPSESAESIVMTTQEEEVAPAVPAITPVDGALHLAEPEAEEACTPVIELRLLKPENVKSRFWIHFMKYDPICHPDKKTFARCNLCGKDISVKQGTGGLKNHLKFKHPPENAVLMGYDLEDPGTRDSYDPESESASATPVKTEAAVEVPDLPMKRMKRGENAYQAITQRMDTASRETEKHWMEMWSMARRELREIRKDLKAEDDPEVIKDLEADARVLTKRKADYAEKLGYEKEEEVQRHV